MYDSQEKAALDLLSNLIDAREEGLKKGLEKGREEGLEEGQIELIQTLQEILGEPVMEAKSLEGQSLQQLQAMSAELRSRVLRRS